MSDHIVSAFTEELEHISADILRMGGMAEAMIEDAIRALTKGDVELGEATAKRDKQLDAMEADIDRQITRVLALRQPMASDLRAVMGAYKIASELERIGDLSKNIARRTGEMTDRKEIKSTLKGIRRMGDAVRRQMQATLDAYSSGDEKAAVTVCVRDDEINEHYNSLFHESLTYMMEDPRTIGTGAHMMFIVKHLERIGDHCTNIAEVVYYQATGNHLTPEEINAARVG